jgi:hypothetical protein
VKWSVALYVLGNLTFLFEWIFFEFLGFSQGLVFVWLLHGIGYLWGACGCCLDLFFLHIGLSFFGGSILWYIVGVGTGCVLLLLVKFLLVFCSY